MKRPARIYVVADDVAGVEFDWDAMVPNFTKEEIFSPACIRDSLYHLIDIESVCKLQRFRDALYDRSRGLRVNQGALRRRGVRTIQDQVELSRTQASSMHVCGKAFDISMVENHDTDWLAEKAVEFGFTGVGLYETFVHVDTRTSYDGKAILWDRR